MSEDYLPFLEIITLKCFFRLVETTLLVHDYSAVEPRLERRSILWLSHSVSEPAPLLHFDFFFAERFEAHISTNFQNNVTTLLLEVSTHHPRVV